MATARRARRFPGAPALDRASIVGSVGRRPTKATIDGLAALTATAPALVRPRSNLMRCSRVMATADLTVIGLGRTDSVTFELGLPRVYTILKLDERRDREQTLEDKVASVERLVEG